MRVSSPPNQLAKVATDIERRMALAATAAVKETGDLALAAGRANIAAAGFSRRWQVGLRIRRPPKRQVASLNAEVFIRHRIGLSGVFEKGKTIAGSRMLWIPLSNSPVRGRLGSKGRISPGQFTKTIAPLHTVRLGGKPFLAARVRLTDKQAAKGRVSLALLKRNPNDGGRGTIRSVPLYVGVKSVTIRKRFDVYAAIARAADGLAERFLKHLGAQQ